MWVWAEEEEEEETVFAAACAVVDAPGAICPIELRRESGPRVSRPALPVTSYGTRNSASDTQPIVPLTNWFSATRSFHTPWLGKPARIGNSGCSGL